MNLLMTFRTVVLLGGERDTLTCIAGGIVEGLYGLMLNMKSKCRKRLPEDMLKVLERSKKLDFLKVWVGSIILVVVKEE